MIFLSVQLLLQSLRLLLHPTLGLKSKNCFLHLVEHAQVFALNILNHEFIVRIGGTTALDKIILHWKQIKPVLDPSTQVYIISNKHNFLLKHVLMFFFF